MVMLCFVVCVVCACVTTDGDTRVFDRSCVSRLGTRGISCKQFSLQRAPPAGVFEAAAFFFDAHEESLGPTRDAPLHCVLIHLDPRGADSGFHLHFVLGLACEALLQHFVDIVVPSLKMWTVFFDSSKQEKNGRQPDNNCNTSFAKVVKKTLIRRNNQKQRLQKVCKNRTRI